VRECLSAQPDLAAEAIHEITGVSIACILRMIDQGVVTSNLLTGTVKCGKCGAPAIGPSKRLCHACLDQMNQQVAKQRSALQQTQRKHVPIGEAARVHRTIEEKRRR
jgi:hypothetical protein